MEKSGENYEKLVRFMKNWWELWKNCENYEKLVRIMNEREWRRWIFVYTKDDDGQLLFDSLPKMMIRQTDDEEDDEEDGGDGDNIEEW